MAGPKNSRPAASVNLPDSANPTLLGTAWRALPGIAFLMLVCLGFLGFLALPVVGKMLASFVCEAGETMVDVQTPYSRPGESGVQEWLSFYLKAPQSELEAGPEHDLFIQQTKLKNTLREWMGEQPVTHSEAG